MRIFVLIYILVVALAGCGVPHSSSLSSYDAQGCDWECVKGCLGDEHVDRETSKRCSSECSDDGSAFKCLG